jgi:ATP-dependent RNA helicase DeaD
VGKAQTGTGKTAAFCLPLLEKIDLEREGIQAIIFSPTRELASQTHQELKKFAQFLSINTALLYGGVGYRQQIDELKRAHIVVATPGRAIDLLNSGRLNVDKSRIFIIDEADEMLKMGFIEDVEQLLDTIPYDAEKWMFSATMPKPIVDLIGTKIDSPEVVSIKNQGMAANNIQQKFLMLERKDFMKGLKAILAVEQDFFGFIFCETKEETKRYAEKLMTVGKRVVCLHGDMGQRERNVAIEQFKNRRAEVMVCTDVGARGLDISQITHVINLGLPRKTDSYIHRIGRTGRAGEDGMAISFVTPAENRKLRMVEQLVQTKLEPYTMPKKTKAKNKMIANDLGKFDGLKSAIMEKGEEFKIDDSFKVFDYYMKDMSREQVLQLLFSYSYNGSLRQIDETLEYLSGAVINPKKVVDKGPRKNSGPRKRNRSFKGRRRRS